jgi:quercetin dioxygenase-like cupin family protein
MKHAIAAAAIVAAALSTTVVISQVEQKSQTTQQTQRFPQFENDDVKVWKTVVLPHQPLAMHHHDHPRVIIALTGGTMNIVDPAGHIEPHVWETGKAYWLPAMPPNTLHSDVNAGDKPMEVMVVELEKEK